MMIKIIKISSEQIIQLKQKGLSQKDMAKIFGVSQQTIIRWKKQKKPAPRERKHKPKNYGNIPELLKSCISKNIATTQWEMAKYVSKQTGQQVSQQTISRILKRERITYKKLTYHYTQLNEEKAKAFNEEIKSLLEKSPFIALDEFSFYPNEDPRCGYSLKGTRAVSRRPSSKGKHYTLLLAIGNLKEKGVIHWKTIEGGADWKVFYDFLEEINPIGSQKNYLLMDNASIHISHRKRKEAGLPNVREQMAKKNIEVRYIVPYAPMLNATELIFNPLRKKIEQSKPRSYEEVNSEIEKAFESLNKEDLRKYFWSCVEYFDKNTYNGKFKNKRKQNDLLPKKRGNTK